MMAKAKQEPASVMTLCASCGCGGSHSGACACGCSCPQISVESNGDAASKRVVISDDHGHQVEMTTAEFREIVDSARTGQLDTMVT